MPTKASGALTENHEMRFLDLKEGSALPHVEVCTKVVTYQTRCLGRKREGIRAPEFCVYPEEISIIISSLLCSVDVLECHIIAVLVPIFQLFRAHADQTATLPDRGVLRDLATFPASA